MKLKDTFDACNATPYWVMQVYTKGLTKPNFPVPSLIGEVIHLWDGLVFEIHIEDADSRFDLRMWYGVSAVSGVLYEYVSADKSVRR